MLAYIFICMFMSGVLVFCLKRKHLLLMLLSLEMIVLALFMYMYMYLSIYMYELFVMLYMLVFCVCESVVGLSLLVLLVRNWGNDYFLSVGLC